METLIDQALAVAARRVSPVELVENSLALLETVETATNAFTHIVADQAIDDARRVEGAPVVGPLHGVPIAIKELYDVEGLSTTGCCAAFEDRVAPTDSAVVAKLRAAGAIVIAKTNQHEMACGATTLVSSFGPVRNPWDPSRIAGGSSSGSAVAVAAGVVTMAMGSDTGGSIRIPSSMCGTTGLKTTHGSVSLRGAMPCVPPLDSGGPLATSARDCIVVYDVISGFDPANVWSRRSAELADRGEVSGVRIAILDAFSRLATKDMRAAVEGAARVFEELGSHIDVVPSPDPSEAWEAVGPIFAAGFAAEYPDLAKDERAHPEVRSLVEGGNAISGTLYAKSIEAARAANRKLSAALEEADFLLAPATPYPAPRSDEVEVDVGGRRIDVRSGGPARLTVPVNLAGLPALSFPVGYSDNGLPLGAQLIGTHWTERQLCEIVAAYQDATEWHTRRPAISSTVM